MHSDHWFILVDRTGRKNMMVDIYRPVTFFEFVHFQFSFYPSPSFTCQHSRSCALIRDALAPKGESSSLGIVEREKKIEKLGVSVDEIVG